MLEYKVAQSLPKVAQSLPKVAQSLSKVAQSLPIVAQKAATAKNFKKILQSGHTAHDRDASVS